jgi:hypothetical protein
MSLKNLIKLLKRKNLKEKLFVLIKVRQNRKSYENVLIEHNKKACDGTLADD